MMRVLVSLLGVLVSIVSYPANGLAVEIVGHRGASFDAPENTVASMKRGWQQQADACELDIRLTKDGRIVLSHDDTTKRTAGRNVKVVDQTFDELRTLDAGRWKGPQWTGERIPTLAEALATIPDGKRMFIELKCGPEVLPELERVLAASGKRDEQLVLIAFNVEVMRQARQRFPKLPMLWLCDYKKNAKTGEFPTVAPLIATAKDLGANGLDVSSKFPITREFTAQVHAAGLALHVWTVDDPDMARHLAEVGVDGITTNRPGWLRSELGATTSPKGPTQ